MNHFYTIKNLLFIFLCLTAARVSGWGTDKVISPFGPSAQHSMAAKQTGVLFAAMPGVGITGPNLVTVYTSTDNGDTWNIAPIGGLPVTGAVVKTKMVVTGLDSIYCVFLQNNILNFVNVESGSFGQFSQSGIQDFDCAASPNGNWIYFWIQEPVNNDIRRYGTIDGGLSFTGNTALVTGNGASPKICQSGTRLILNYYGPVAPDTATSAIRAAYYDETAPGTLAAGTFQDLVLNTGVKRKQFQTVLIDGIAWFIFTEGDLQQVLKCMVSQDNGLNYQPEFVIDGDASLSAYWFGIAPYVNPVGSGITLTYLADSISPIGSGFDQMQFETASTLSPSAFISFPSPNNTYNDTSVVSAASGVLPIVVNYFSGTANESGIAWVGDSPQGPWLYFDRLNATVGVNEYNFSGNINIYPSPANNLLQVCTDKIIKNDLTYQVLDMKGRSIMQRRINSGIGTLHFTIDISALTSGNYILRLVTDNYSGHARFIVM